MDRIGRRGRVAVEDGSSYVQAQWYVSLTACALATATTGRDNLTLLPPSPLPPPPLPPSPLPPLPLPLPPPSLLPPSLPPSPSGSLQVSAVTRVAREGSLASGSSACCATTLISARTATRLGRLGRGDTAPLTPCSASSPGSTTVSSLNLPVALECLY